MDSPQPILLSVKIFSNRGTPFIETAIKEIQKHFKVIDISSVYMVDRPAETWAGLRDLKKEERLEGLVLAIKAETGLSALQTLQRLQLIEAGQQQEVLSRSLSINLLAYAGEVISSPDLCLPHPEMHLRPEDVIPSIEVWPLYEHPVLKKSLIELSKEFKNQKWGQYHSQGRIFL